jgi:hypothetical protein
MHLFTRLYADYKERAGIIWLGAPNPIPEQCSMPPLAMTLPRQRIIMLRKADGVAVQKYKPKSTPHILDQIQEQSSVRAKKTVESSQDAIAHSKKLLSDSQRALEATNQVLGRLRQA